MGEVFKRKLAIDPPARVFELLADISAHDVAEAVHGLTTGEYLAKTDRADQLVERMRLIKEVEAETDLTEIELTGLDIKAHKFYLLIAVIKNPQASNSFIHLFVEGDEVKTNYYNQFLYDSHTTISSYRENFPALFYVYAGNRSFSVCYIELDPDGYFRYYSLNVRRTGSGVESILWSGCKTATITNITKLKIKANVTNAIGKGSKFMLLAGKVE